MRIPRNLDNPWRVMLFDVDEFIITFAGFYIFAYNRQLLYGIICGVTVFYLYRKYKKTRSFNPKVVIDWYLPRKRYRFPPSNYRRFYG